MCNEFDHGQCKIGLKIMLQINFNNQASSPLIDSNLGFFLLVIWK